MSATYHDISKNLSVGDECDAPESDHTCGGTLEYQQPPADRPDETGYIVCRKHPHFHARPATADEKARFST